VRIIPVIDLMGGIVVRGVAGRRSEYRPLRSRLCESSEPAAVAHALVEHFGLPELYVADLDAIADGEPAWQVYEQLAASGVRLSVDAGVADVARAAALADFCAAKETLSGVIAGLESVASPRILKEMVAAIGAERLVFSLDLKSGQPLTSEKAWRDLTPAGVATAAIDVGIKRMIVLDLADVGVGGGVRTLELCRELRFAHPNCELIAGGGVRGPDDLRLMAAAGCDAALVASALHDGRIRNDESRAMNG
jgi:phosphoribosylformimino-5-aminoimidazole carboxamide ribotide isomerase